MMSPSARRPRRNPALGRTTATTAGLRAARLLTLSLAAAIVAACGGNDSTYGSGPVDGTPPPAPGTVRATTSIQFTPGQITIAAGQTVTFEFGALAHTVFFDDAPAGAPANISAASANKSVALTFNTKGTFPYNCHIHPGMSGTVVVQ
jgi:plastocyanin